VKVQKKSQVQKTIKQEVKKNIVQTETKPAKGQMFLWIAIIAFVTFLSYSSALKNDIINWDDDQYIVKNPWLQDLSKENTKQIFSEFYMGNYHPLAMLSLSLDFQIGGLDKKGEIKPGIFHFTNLLLHIFNTLLVFWLVFLLFSRKEIAIISSLLFGLSTLHVESVAWISERKDVIYALFFIASLIAYVYYVKRRKIKYYIYALILFIFSLFSKGQAVSLAITLFAIDYLFNRKLLDKKLLLEKLPFLVLALIFGIIAIKAQKAGNALQEVDSYEFYKRIGFAGYAFTQYIFKLFIPEGLSAINAYPDIINKSIPAYYWLFLIPAIFSVLAFFYYLKRSKIVAFCIAFFIINIFLLLQLIPVGSAIWADRYSYIPSIGYYSLIAWLIYQLIAKINTNRALVYGLTGVYLIAIAYTSYERCKIWGDSMDLWNDTIKNSPEAVVAWNNRGSIKDKEKDHQGAIEDFTQAIIRKPDYKHAFYNRGTAKKNLADLKKDSMLVKSAIEDFNMAIKIDSVFVEAFRNRAQAEESLADYAKSEIQKTTLLNEALRDLDKTISINPNTESALVSRGVVKGKLNRFDQAIEDFNQAIALAPDSASAWSNRGLAKDFKMDFKGAIADYTKAIQLNPLFEKAFYNRGISYRKLNDINASIKDFTEAIRLSPNMTEAYYYRGLNYVLIKNMDFACKDFDNAARQGNIAAKQQLAIYCNNQVKYPLHNKP
jgi:protein O-mannosyl-transferase